MELNEIDLEATRSQCKSQKYCCADTIGSLKNPNMGVSVQDQASSERLFLVV
jgi:hypothetical protein